MELLLADKVCLITGAGTGIGAGAAKTFAREGAKLVLAGRRLETLEQTRRDVIELGGEAICVATDVTKADDCKRLVQAATDRFGRLDCALNNAAIGAVQALTHEYPEDAWDETFAINVKGVWNCMRFEIAQMLTNGGGAIVNVSSASTQPMQPFMSAYVASKYAVNGLTKTAGFEYAKSNIRINALVLGTINTPLLEQAIALNPAFEELLVRESAQGRLGTVEECGEAAAWLLSDRNSFMVGANVVVDGGYSLPRRMS